MEMGLGYGGDESEDLEEDANEVRFGGGLLALEKLGGLVVRAAWTGRSGGGYDGLAKYVACGTMGWREDDVLVREGGTYAACPYGSACW